MDKKDIYEAKEKLSFVHGQSIILKEIDNIEKINHLKEYRKELDFKIRKELVIAGQKLVDANLAAAEAYMKEEESINKEN